MTNEELLNHLYYNKLPEVYRTADRYYGFALKRYLQALVEGGYGEQLEDIEEFITLVDPIKCSEKFIPYFLGSFGISYNYSIPASYQRKVLANIGELIKRRGTHSCINFLVRVLTGIQVVTQQYIRGEYEGKQGRHLVITLQVDTLEQLNSVRNYLNFVEEYLKDFIPYYIYPHLISHTSIIPVETTLISHYTHFGYSTHHEIGGK